MIDIIEIHEPSEKSSVCDNILRSLPNWFGNETAIVDYSKQVGAMPFYAAFYDDKTVGFVALKIHNIYTAEICVMGILREYHRMGIGRMFIERCECHCASLNIEYLTVKTLDESRESKSYEKTRHFYYAVGFRPLEVFPLLWDEDNPCLFMVKYIRQ